MNYGGLAQLARALALQARGHRFESDILHSETKVSTIFDILTQSDNIRINHEG